ncbi:MAG: homoserine dehydrogenase [Tenericutes bacterium]|jgi:homoserine dehydrogenase|nr:homoserine dehydrogenase [Mycoplasmatota bacterium]
MNAALLGFGVVGKGVYEIIQNDFPNIKITAILVKNKDKHQEIQSLLVDSYDEILKDPSVEVVIECISSKSFAYQAIKKALMNHKHVVTANKAVISDYFKELTTLAKKNKVQLRYEASVAAAIIVLDPIQTIAKVNQIHQVEGILNGSTNYILSRIFLDNQTIEDAINEAHRLGYLETGSDDDIEGLDPMRKINIISMLAYQTYLNEDDILRIPLSNFNERFIKHIKEKGLSMKYIAKSLIQENQLSLRVEPLIISSSSFLNKINYEENFVSIDGKYHKKQSFIGQGAGRYPTAQAMVYDLIKIKNQETSECSFEQRYQVNNNLKASFLVQTKNDGFKTIKAKYFQLLNDQDIICFARLEEGLYGTI